MKDNIDIITKLLFDAAGKGRGAMKKNKSNEDIEGAGEFISYLKSVFCTSADDEAARAAHKAEKNFMARLPASLCEEYQSIIDTVVSDHTNGKAPELDKALHRRIAALTDDVDFQDAHFQMIAEGIQESEAILAQMFGAPPKATLH